MTAGAKIVELNLTIYGTVYYRYRKYFDSLLPSNNSVDIVRSITIKHTLNSL